MTRHVSRAATRFTAASLVALAMAGAAQAHESHAWDQQIQVKQRFVVLKGFNDQAVLDRETQLVWQRAPTVQPFFSRDEAAGLAGDEDGCFHTQTGGRHGWRLPSIHELNTLLVNRVLPAGHPFLNVQTGFTDFYWSATMRQSDPTVTLGLGFDGSGPALVGLPAGSVARAWCVRASGADSTLY
jgi:hypothetical protein